MPCVARWRSACRTSSSPLSNPARVRATQRRSQNLRHSRQRFLGRRLDGYDPAVHLGGITYLFMRGMVGANVPAILRALVACGWFGIQAWIGGMAIFSIFRHTAEQPLFAIAKVPGSSQGGYMVYNGPRKLAHGETLEDVLKVFERKLKLLNT